MNAEPTNTDKECRLFEETLSAHFDGVADEIARAEALEHLRSCAACNRAWREWQEIKEMQQRALQPLPSSLSRAVIPLAPVRPPYNLQKNILRQTTRLKAPWWRITWQRSLIASAVPALAVICGIFFASEPWQHSRYSTESPAQQSSVSSAGRHSAAGKPDHLALLPAPNNANVTPAKQTAPSPKAAPNAQNAVSDERTKLVESVSFQSSHKKVLLKVSKSTFKSDVNRRNIRSNTSPVITPLAPQLSLVSTKQPRSRSARVVSDVVPKRPVLEPLAAVQTLPTPRMTAIDSDTSNNTTAETRRIADLSTDLSSDETASNAEYEEVSDPVYDYITAHDEHPSEIRQAVENYRSALLAMYINPAEF